MKFRQADIKDVDQMMIIVQQAQEDLKNMKVNQWQNGYPNAAVLLDDIQKSKAYVADDGRICGLMVCSINDETTYDPLKTWKAETYLVVHRFAVCREVQRQGVATSLIDYAKLLAQKHGLDSLRIDTHEKNVRMRRFLEKCNFEERGFITLKDGSPRIAYELLL